MSFACPACGTRNQVGLECVECGYQPPKKGRRDRIEEAKNGGSAGACEFRFRNGHHCPLPGNLSDNVREGGPWYCLKHYRSEQRGNMKANDELHDELSRPGGVEAVLRRLYPSSFRSVADIVAERAVSGDRNEARDRMRRELSRHDDVRARNA